MDLECLSCDQDFPVSKVQWKTAIEYCEKLTKWDHTHGCLPLDLKYSLPTDAQWSILVGDAKLEDAVTSLDLDEPIEKPRKVGSKGPNQYGLYDTRGNVDEWCLDTYQPTMNTPQFHSLLEINPNFAEYYKVCRGGSCDTSLKEAMDVEARIPLLAYHTANYQNVGFRVVVLAT